MADFEVGDVVRWTNQDWIENQATEESKATVRKHSGPFIFIGNTPGTKFVRLRRMNGKMLTLWIFRQRRVFNRRSAGSQITQQEGGRT